MNPLNNIRQKRYVIVAGAGISMSQPSNLPGWWQYNKTIINVIKEQACELCPEASETRRKQRACLLPSGWF